MTTAIDQYKRLQAVLGTTVDGIPGPKDEAAYQQLRRKVQEERALSVTPSRSSALGAAIVAAAQSQIGVLEKSKNQAPEIAKYWAATNYPDGMQNREPWCAAFVCWCVAEGIRNFGKNPNWALPRTATAFGFEDWAEEYKLPVNTNPASSDLQLGDILVFKFSHVGIYAGGVNAESIVTIEGNTNGAGSREGDGVYRKLRPVSLVRSAVRIS